MSDPINPVSLDALLAHRAWVRTVALAMVADPNRADDVEQEAWLAALQRPPSHGRSLRGWLGAVTRNAARRLLRDSATRQRHEVSAPGHSADVPAVDLVAEAEIQQRIARAVLDLDEPFRTAVLLRYFEALAVGEIATRLSVPVETVRSRLRRGLDQLRGRMDAESHGRRSAWALPVLSWGRRAPPPGNGWPWGQVAAAMGGLAMKKLVAVAALAFVLVVTGMATRELWIGDGSASNAGADQAASGADVRVHRQRVSESETASDETRGLSLPPPVDLDAADRDLDVHGVVVDPDGAPVAGASVSALSYPWRGDGLGGDLYERVAGPETRAASDGTFALRLERAQQVSLCVSARGFAPVELPMVAAGCRVRVTLHAGVRLVVIAHDATERPLVDALVRVSSHWLDAAGTVRVQGSTDESGRCVFDDLPPLVAVRVRVDHATGSLGLSPLSVELPSEGELRREILVPRGRTLTGRVTDVATGAPVLGARIDADDPEGSFAKTDTDGRYELPGWCGTEDGSARIRATAPGYAAEWRYPVRASEVDMALRRAVTLRGRVVAIDGTPVVAACVGLCAADELGPPVEISYGRTMVMLATNRQFAITDEAGRFEVTGLWPGLLHRLAIAARGWPRLRKDVTLPSGMDTIDLGDILVGGMPHRVEGVVLDLDGTPRSRVQVSLIDGDSERDTEPRGLRYFAYRQTVLTDDLGRFRFGDLAAGAYCVEVAADSAANERREVQVPEEGDVLDVRIVCTATRRVVVVVQDQDGLPIEGAYASAMADMIGGNPLHVYAQSDEAGRAVLDVPRGRTLKLAVTTLRVTGRRFVVAPTQWLAADDSEVSVTLEEAAEVEGRVIDPQGDPIPGAALRVLGSDGAVPRIVIADERGSFRTDIGVSGSWSIVFDGGVKRGNRAQHEDLALAARVDGVRPSTEVLLRAEPLRLDRTLRLHVVSPDDTPIPGATVRVSRGTLPSARVVCDASGRAVVEGLPEWALRVDVTLPSGVELLAPQFMTVVPEDQELHLRCRPAARITGTVIGADGLPRRWPVVARRAGVRVAVAHLGEDGRFVLLFDPDDNLPVRLEGEPYPGLGPECVLEGIVPGTEGVRLVESRSR